jgi:2,3-bisphosphoglycerate-independent phosphoglycerate mutase
MIDFPGLKEIVSATPSKIVMLVVDGLGGLPHPDTGISELEAANIPNLNSLAQKSACGLTTPVIPGIAPGSGPGHLGLFGYDPVKYLIGRGVLEALGIGVQLEDSDIAIRGNFCTLDGEGRISDRRAGRLSSDEAIPLCMELNSIKIPGVGISVYPVKDYRLALVLRGDGLSDQVSETDPGRLGLPPVECRATGELGGKTAHVVNTFLAESKKLLTNHAKANTVLLRGFSSLPDLPSMVDRYCLTPAAIAAYPMYRGLASLVGMWVIPTGTEFAHEIETLAESFSQHDFFYIHYKPADAAGEDGDFSAKVKALEVLDGYLPELLEMNPDVFIVAGDHATPSVLASHSWHPVPFLICSKWTLGEGVEAFNEKDCGKGSIGQISATHLMLLALANADKLTKFGP